MQLHPRRSSKRIKQQGLTGPLPYDITKIVEQQEGASTNSIFTNNLQKEVNCSDHPRNQNAVRKHPENLSYAGQDLPHVGGQGQQVPDL